MNKILVVAGELSGDMHAAELIRAMKALNPNLTCFGVGGDHCRDAGMELLFHTDDTAVMGFVEVLRHLRFFSRMFHTLLDQLRIRRPDAVLLIDYPGFNLRFASKARKLGFRVIYYVCPQVWAWHRERIPKMAQVIDRLITIFPFEAAHFDGTGLDVVFAGHPLVDAWEQERAAAPAPLPWDSAAPGVPRIALLPGSRRNEITRLAPRIIEAATEILETDPSSRFLVACPSPRVEQMFRNAVPHLPAGVSVATGRTRAVLRSATAALVASGTATIETALAGCPQVIVYRVAPLTYQLFKRLIRIPWIGMVNVVAGREICPELVQRKATAANMAHALRPLLTETPQRTAMIAALQDVADKLGAPGTHARAARAALDLPDGQHMGQP